MNDLVSTKIDRSLLARLFSGKEPKPDPESFSTEDWHQIVNLAVSENVAGLLYHKLEQSGEISLIPRWEQKHLRALTSSIRMKNEQLLHELEELTTSFAGARIPVVALKGICYALTIYEDLGLRPMVDMDLLVPDQCLSEAVEIARSQGYKDIVPEATAGSNALLNNGVSLVKSKFPFCMLELHNSLMGEGAFTFAVPMEWFWIQTEALFESESLWPLERLQMLTPTAQLLYACAHAMLEHGGRGSSLCWFNDLDRLVCVYGNCMDWNLFLSQARALGWSSAASAALTQTVELFDTPVPAEVLGSLAAQPDRHTERVKEMQLQPLTRTVEQFQTFKSLRLAGKIKLLQGLVVPSTQYMRWRYGVKSSWRLPGWYLYRWWGILKDGVRTLMYVLER